MRILLFGASGQLGRFLQKTKPNGVELITPSRAEVNFTAGNTLCDFIINQSPDWVINAAAYTDVDKAEEERLFASDINHGGPSCIAWACQFSNSKLLHISTDYVFDGSAIRPYELDDSPCPVNYYGYTKLRGEQAIADILSSTPFCILRTSWLYSAFRKNFFVSVFKKLLFDRDFEVVNDQYGRPTSAICLAKVCWQIVLRDITGLHHFAEAPSMSRHAFALKIRSAAETTCVGDSLSRVMGVPSRKYKTRALRPMYSVLSNSISLDELGLGDNDWEKNIEAAVYDYVFRDPS
jgi:dTDP-4-dehydrorhamnose reductase